VTSSAKTLPAHTLLSWYDRHRRTLPWRSLTGEHPDPYRVWLSEIMLQQTTVTAVKPYYDRFLTLFPTIEALAQAPEQQVMAAWAGLGYYARARNLHACAKQVASLGQFPSTVETLQALPGIGAYTSRAIAAIAFGIPVVPVDGNVERIVSRLFAITAPLPKSRPTLATLAATLNTEPEAWSRASDFAQALFDLGASICTPRSPACALCPWRPHCAAQKQGLAEQLPAKTPKTAKPNRYGAHFIIRDATGALWLRHRPNEGLLGGMAELPGTAWTPTEWTDHAAHAAAPIHATWRRLGNVQHVFTHFALTLTVYETDVTSFHPLGNQPGFPCPPDALSRQALPSVMRKCLALLDKSAKPPRTSRRTTGKKITP